MVDSGWVRGNGYRVCGVDQAGRVLGLLGLCCFILDQLCFFGHGQDLIVDFKD